MKARIKNIVVILLLIAVLMAIVFSMAYFTHYSEQRNVFTVGKVDIVLTEEKYNLPENIKAREHLSPGEKLIKDPKVTNTGNSDTFVFVEIFMPRTNRIRIDSNGQKLPEEYRNAFLFTKKEQWVEVEKHTVKDSNGKPYYHYVYAYAMGDKTTGRMIALRKGETTPTVFKDDLLNHRKFIETEEQINYIIPVYAYAIQTTDIVITDNMNDEGKTDPVSVWSIIREQINSEKRSELP